MMPGFWQILIIVLVILLFFGTKRLPGMMEDVAKGIKGFKKGLKDEDDEQTRALSHKKDKDDVIDAKAEKAEPSQKD